MSNKEESPVSSRIQRTWEEELNYAEELSVVHVALILANLIERCNVTNKQLAEKAEVSEYFISQILSADSDLQAVAGLTVKALARIGRALGYKLRCRFEPENNYPPGGGSLEYKPKHIINTTDLSKAATTERNATVVYIRNAANKLRENAKWLLEHSDSDGARASEGLIEEAERIEGIANKIERGEHTFGTPVLIKVIPAVVVQRSLRAHETCDYCGLYLEGGREMAGNLCHCSRCLNCEAPMGDTSDYYCYSCSKEVETPEAPQQ
jgi:transcriptional regulator with XRE-family HTH domain